LDYDEWVRFARNPLFLLIFFGLLLVATRLPLAPGQIFTFDDVNLAYSIGHYDIRISQPHPPGYPLFVAEMRVLHWLRFKRAESILLVLALLGGIAALLTAVYTGNLIFGGDSGFWGALVLLLAPPFWHAGVTSALRVQLAIVSLGVAACCWKAWRGEGAWVARSAVALALGAGIRPETGVLLFPLWAASALRAKAGWGQRLRALLWMAATVLVWLLPAMLASGGPLSFIRANLDYISDQASVSSGLFGAAEGVWMRTFFRLIAWVFAGLLGLVLAGIVAWRRGEGWGIGGARAAFLGLWLAPAFAFALNVHVEDPGQTLIMGVAVALFGGYLIERALDRMELDATGYLVPGLLAAACIAGWQKPNDASRLLWLAALAAAAGFAFKLAPLKNGGWLSRRQAGLLLVAPVLYTNWIYFSHRGWYYRGAATSGFAAAAEHAWADLNSAFALTSLEQIETTLATDDRSLRETRRLAAERPDSIVLWEHGLVAWRKVCYYMPREKVLVLDHKTIRGGALVADQWQGAHLLARQQGTVPLRVILPAGARVIWLLDPRGEFSALVKQAFALNAAGPVYYDDLPSTPGSRVLGEYELVWQARNPEGPGAGSDSRRRSGLAAPAERGPGRTALDRALFAAHRR
jgi:hypothetical protein